MWNVSRILVEQTMTLRWEAFWRRDDAIGDVATWLRVPPRKSGFFSQLNSDYSSDILVWLDF